MMNDFKDFGFIFQKYINLKFISGDISTINCTAEP